MSGMSDEARTNALAELTRGAGGTIQAMRFLNLAVKDNGDLFGDMVGRMNNASGAMGDAYDIMLEQPQSQMQLLKNNWQILQTEIGDAVIPVFNRLVQVGLSVVRWFRDMNPETRKVIVIVTALGAALMTVAGVITGLAGAFLVIKGSLALAGTSLTAFLGPVALVIAAVAAVAAGVYLLVTHWDSIRPHVQPIIDWFQTTVVPALQIVAQAIVQKFGEVVAWFQTNWPAIKEAIGHVLNVIVDIVSGFIDIVMDFWEGFGDDIMEIVQDAWDFISEYISTVMGIIQGVIETVIAIINGDWGVAWDKIKETVSKAWDGIKEIHTKALDLLLSILKFVMGLLNSAWDTAWQTVKDIVTGIWPLITEVVDTGINAILDFFRELPGDVVDLISSLPERLLWIGAATFNGLWDGMKRVWDTVRGWLGAMDDRVVDAVEGLARSLYNIGREILQGLWDGMKDVWSNVTGWLSNLNPLNHFNDINLAKGHAEKNLIPAGKAVFEGLQNGMKSGWKDTTAWLSSIDPSLTFGANGAVPGLTRGSLSPVGMQGGAGALHVDGPLMQIVVEGNVTEDVLPQLEEMIDGKIDEFARLVVALKTQGVH
jgi:phage-related protein